MMMSKSLFRLSVATTIGVAMAGIACTGVAQTQAPASPQSREAGGKQKRSYYPLAVGNWWSYKVKDPRKKTTTVKWQVVRKEKEADYGPEAYQLTATPVQSDEPTILASRENGIVEPDTGNVLLKNPLQTGDRWSDRSSFSPNTYEVISAGKPCAAGGRRFRDCAIVRERDEKAALVTLKTYARGVGPVSFVYYKGLDEKKVDSTVTIESWGVK